MQLPTHLAQSTSTTDFINQLAAPASAPFLNSLASDHPHMNWPYDPYRSPDHATANRIAQAILQSKRQPDSASNITALIPPCDPHQTWYHETLPALRDSLGTLHPQVDHQEIETAICDHWHDAVTIADTSSPSDTLSSHDTCELLFSFTQSLSFEDHLIESHKAWSDPGELAITEDLQFALTQIGYTVTRFRKIAKNHHPSWQPLTSKSPRRAQVVEPGKLLQAIDNACSRTFIFALYAIAPLQDVFEIDLTRDISFSKCWLSVLDPINGTFHDEPIDTQIIVAPGDGHLISGADLAWSPDEICGLYRPHYHARIINPVHPN